ncbi:WD40 repeat domain-containing protein [Nonomuraea sp. bgisy101]|uniref:WD40 repeat domain-containing protein n=1 Tax=Nonomuraea sp. bgisy101 TaxID=3413784 RepID=UPI003D74B973
MNVRLGVKGLVVIGLVVLSVIATVGSSLVYLQQEAFMNERILLARSLAFHASELRDVDPYTSLTLGVAAVHINENAASRKALFESFLVLRREDLFAQNPRGARSVALSQDGHVALIKDADEIGVWDLSGVLDPNIEGEVEKRAGLEGDYEDVDALALSSDGRTALIGQDNGTAVLWDLKNLAQPTRLGAINTGAASEADRGIESLALSRDGRTACVGDFDGNFSIWDLSVKTKPIRRSHVRLPSGPISSISLDAHARLAATLAKDRYVAIWDLGRHDDPIQRSSLDLPFKSAGPISITADGREILVGNSRRAGVWSLADPAAPIHTATLDMPNQDLHGIALSDSGKIALFAGDGGSVPLWDLSMQSRPTSISSLKNYSQEVGYVAVSANGEVALTASPDRGVTMWDLRDLPEMLEDPVDVVCDAQGDLKITREEWTRYAGDVDWTRYGGGLFGEDTLAACSIDWVLSLNPRGEAGKVMWGAL